QRDCGLLPDRPSTLSVLVVAIDGHESEGSVTYRGFPLYGCHERGIQHDPPDNQIRLPADSFRAGILRMEGVPRVAAPAAEVGGRHHLRVHADAGHGTPGGIDWCDSRAGDDGADVSENGDVESVPGNA